MEKGNKQIDCFRNCTRLQPCLYLLMTFLRKLRFYELDSAGSSRDTCRSTFLYLLTQAHNSLCEFNMLTMPFCIS